MRNLMRAGILALALAGIIVPVTAASAASSPAVGTWRIHDTGQGCWGGGAMFADNSLGGGGGCSIVTPLGHEIASIVPQSWSILLPGRFLICLNIVVKSGPAFPVPAGQICFPMQATSGAPLPVPLGPDTLGKVVLAG